VFNYISNSPPVLLLSTIKTLIQIKQSNSLLFSYLNIIASLNYQIQQLTKKQFQLLNIYVSIFKTPRQNIQIEW